MGQGAERRAVVLSEDERQLVLAFREGGSVGVIVWAERLVESRQPMAQAGGVTPRTESALASSGTRLR